MSLSEFELIRCYFQSSGANRADVILGIGDDCALLQPAAAQQLAVSTDTLLSGVHFFPDVDPKSLGHKALAVNLSDLAAMGAQPAWVSLAITLPSVDESWLSSFSNGFSRLAKKYNVQLVGGDTTRGPLSITVQVMGFVSPNQSLRRDAACSGDSVYVTGTLGDAALALQMLQREDIGNVPNGLLQQLLTPTPRVEFGIALPKYTNCAIDVSDGLLADLGHIATASCVGVELQLDKLPLSAQYLAGVEDGKSRSLALTGGDDYELCLAVKPEQCSNVESLAQEQGLQLTRIGRVVSGSGVHCVDESGRIVALETGGFDHFQNSNQG